MPFDRFLIAPFDIGQETDVKPWILPDQAFAKLENAYVWRGRVKKRFGSRLMGNATNPALAQLQSRLRIAVATTAANAASGTIPGTTIAADVGQAFSIDTHIYTVNVAGNPATLLDTGTTTVKTFDTTTGAFNFSGFSPAIPDGTAVYWYPAFPVMGLTIYERGEPTAQPTLAFDTKFAYKWNTSIQAWERSGTSTAPEWHGTTISYFSLETWRGITPDLIILFASNFNANLGTASVDDDPIWSLNNTTWSPFSYSPNLTINPTNQQPLTVTQTTSGNNQIIQNYVQTAKIVVAFKNRLLLLNTIENNANGATAFDPLNPTTSGITPANYATSTNTAFVNRCRFSINGSPFASNAWLERNQTYNPGATGTVFAGGGGFTDAPTSEAIVSAQFIKDRLIVFFENSTYELAYTGNDQLPFVWQKLNTELGSQSLNSSVPFDKVILTIGAQGIHACNGSNVERIDESIPDKIFEVIDTLIQPIRIFGIRDYYTELVYWCFPNDSQLAQQQYSNRVMVYNYRNGSWAFNDDCFTVFGYFQQAQEAQWGNNALTWNPSSGTWNLGLYNTSYKMILAGNPEGYIIFIDPDQARNAPAMQITDMNQTDPDTLLPLAPNKVHLKIIDHSLNQGDFIAIENASGVTVLNDQIFQVSQLFSGTNDIEIDIGNITYSGTYSGGGTMTRVSEINILTKQFNPYVNTDRSVFIQRVDFGVQTTVNGEILVDYYPGYSNYSMLDGSISTGAIMGTGVLETKPYTTVPFEKQQTQLWHPIYLQTSAEAIQLNLKFKFSQITNPLIAWSPFEMHGMILWTKPTTQGLQ